MQFKSLFPGRRQYVHQVHYLEWIFKISKQDCKGKRLSTQKPEKEDAVLCEIFVIPTPEQAQNLKEKRVH